MWTVHCFTISLSVRLLVQRDCQFFCQSLTSKCGYFGFFILFYGDEEGFILEVRERAREYSSVWVSLCTLVLWWILIYDFVSRPPINQVVNRLLWNKFLRDLVYGRVWDASICYRFPASQDVGGRERERKSEKEQNELRHQLILFAVICFISLCHNSIFCLYFISHRKRKRLAIFIMFKIHSEASKNAQPRF